jgi:hypothetical protein
VDWKTASDAPLTMNATAAGIVPRAGRITGSGDQTVLDPAQNNSFKLIARALADGGKIAYQPGTDGRSRYVVSGVAPAKMDAWASELWVTGERTSGASTIATAGSPPRVGLANEGMAWTEWLFDTHGIKYTKVTNADLQAGNLVSKFDVLFLPNGVGGFGRGGGGGGGGGRGGRGGGAGAAAATTAITKSVDDFVRAGGTVVSWANGAVSTATALQLPVRSVTAGIARKDYFTGTSVMQVSIDASHPVMAGMPETTYVTVNQPPSFTTTDGFEGAVIAKYPSQGSPLRSGFLTEGAEKYLQGYAAAVDVKHGSGHVVLFAFNPDWRGQPTGTFRVLFNSMFFGKDVAAQAKAAPGFWTPPAK